MEKYGNSIIDIKARYEDYEKKLNDLDNKTSIKDTHQEATIEIDMICKKGLRWKNTFGGKSTFDENDKGKKGQKNRSKSIEAPKKEKDKKGKKDKKDKGKDSSKSVSNIEDIE